VIGAPDTLGAGPVWGTAYVFERAGATWGPATPLLHDEAAAPFDSFGAAVAIEGDTIVIGSAYEEIVDVGAAYVFGRSSGIWTQRQRLLASDGSAGAYFGASVGVSG